MTQQRTLYQRTADRLRVNGWGQRDMRVCLLGALFAEGATQREVGAVADAVAGRCREPASYVIVAWNDAPGRTRDEVLELLRGMR